MKRIPKVLMPLLIGLMLSTAVEAQFQAPDTILVDARILTVDAADNEFSALAITGEHISALGATGDIRALADENTRVIDLDGRTVIPGLIDSHIHAIRAGVDTARQVNWYDAGSVEQAIGRLREAADELPDDIWLYVVGAWNQRRITQSISSICGKLRL
jgi:predicted amidohydrolase YtcJ